MKRITQPSTWAAMAVLFQLAKAFVPAQYHPVVDSVSTAAAGLGVALNEKPAA
jgi:energy-converting hydrogenase Eha subunit E